MILILLIILVVVLFATREILNIKNPTNDVARLLDNSSDKILQII